MSLTTGERVLAAVGIGAALVAGALLFNASSVPALVIKEASCQVRDFCRDTIADGGLSARYRTVRVLAVQVDLPDDAGTLLVPRWPRRLNRDCFELAGTRDEACQVLADSFDDGGTARVGADQDRCACRARGQLCRYTQLDGGLAPMNFGQTYVALQAPFQGGGCTRKSCTEAAGELGQSTPAECL